MTKPIRLPISVDLAKVRSDPPALDARLTAACSFVRGGVVADVGTDHAYVPVALLGRGICCFAVATDIHKGPAQTAAANLGEHGFGDDRAAVLLTDGLCGCESYAPHDVCILGMGGEMIVHIIEQAPWVKENNVRLILQPMTRMETLRAYLDANGFCVVDECMVKADRIYQILCVEYDGIVRTHSPLELLLGEHNIQRRDTLCLELARQQKAILESSRAGKLRSKSPDTSREDALLATIHAFLSNDTEDT